MKQLQNNFTTVEQSKKLLELGVPADSADCIRTLYKRQNDDKQIEVLIEPFSVTVNESFDSADIKIFPCWSVGRLIEIVSICYTGTKFYYSPKSSHKVEFWLERIEKWSKIGFMNFSKLEG